MVSRAWLQTSLNRFLNRYNDKLIRWDQSDDDDDGWTRRKLDTKQLFALTFSPVTSDDTGTYICLMNNRRQPDSPVYLTVEGKNQFISRNTVLQALFEFIYLVLVKVKNEKIWGPFWMQN